MRLDTEVALPRLDALSVWRTPHGLILGRELENYTGLSGQRRIALVDVVGRVHHFDAADIRAGE